MYGTGSPSATIRRNDPYRDYALQVRQVCNAAGVPIIYVGYYLRYGREIWTLKARRRRTGNTLVSEVAIRVAKWKHIGLSEEVLQAIHSNVFTVPIPAPGAGLGL